MPGRRGHGEGSIYRRADGRWEGKLDLGDQAGRRRRKSIYGSTRSEVHRKLTAALQAMNQGLPPHDETTTVGEYLDRWLSLVAGKVRPRTFRWYEEIVRLHLAPSLGTVRLAKLTPDHVREMMTAAAAHGRSPQSVNHDRAVLRAALNAAQKSHLVHRNAAALAEPLRVRKQEVHPLTPADARSILHAVRGDRLEALFTVALSVGLRQSEALGLRWTDIDLEAGSLSIRRTLQRLNGEWLFEQPKTERSTRTVALPRPVVGSLREHRSRQLEERLKAGPAWRGDDWGDLVFATEIGEPMHGTGVGKRFRRLVSEAGLPDMRYHHLRHGAASLMAAHGVPPRVAMEVLGHAQISTTMNIYSHVAPETAKLAADRVEEAIWGAS